MKLRFSTAFHSQTVGKIKHVNNVFNQYFWNLMDADQQDWAMWVKWSFNCNVVMRLATKGLTFMMVIEWMRYNLLT
jgi:hypothetical protein